MTHYYIYYRVRPEQAEGLQQQVAAMQAELAADTGVVGRLLRRRDDAGMWMEIYEDVQDAAFEAALQQATEKWNLGPLLASARTVERFVSLSPPAANA